MGRPPKPSALKKLEGTFREDRAVNEAPLIGKVILPKWVTDPDARKEFRRLAKLLGQMGLTGGADSNLLTRYCTTWVRWRRVSQTLMTNDSAEYAIYKDTDDKPKSIQVSALHSIARSLADELSRCEQCLGMTPSARSRINVTPTSNQPDALDTFLNAPPMRIAQ